MGAPPPARGSVAGPMKAWVRIKMIDGSSTIPNSLKQAIHNFLKNYGLQEGLDASTSGYNSATALRFTVLNDGYSFWYDSTLDDAAGSLRSSFRNACTAIRDNLAGIIGPGASMIPWNDMAYGTTPLSSNSLSQVTGITEDPN